MWWLIFVWTITEQYALMSTMYSIPEKFRKIENFHILLWLLKDMSWAMLWKPLGIVMIFPTVFVAILITWQTRKLKAEFYHNLAVISWILANVYWMVAEFLEAPDHYRYYAAIPFTLGLIFITTYYTVILPQEKRRMKTEMIETEIPSSVTDKEKPH